MNTFKALLVVSVIAACALCTQPVVNAQTDRRLTTLESPRATVLASNSTTAQIDFTTPNSVLADYEITDLSGNLSLQLTNLVGDRTRRVFIDTDGTARTISVATNGLTRTVEILWPYNYVNTNGASGITATNRTRVDITSNSKSNLVYVNFWHYH